MGRKLKKARQEKQRRRRGQRRGLDPWASLTPDSWRARLVASCDCSPTLVALAAITPGEEEFAARASYNVAAALLGAGRREEALTYLRRALELMPDHPQHTPNEVLADLTPAQVWAGTGPTENTLITDFLRDWTEAVDSESYESRGQLLREALLFLRGWPIRPRSEHGLRSAVSAVRAERDATYGRKRRIMEALDS